MSPQHPKGTGCRPHSTPAPWQSAWLATVTTVLLRETFFFSFLSVMLSFLSLCDIALNWLILTCRPRWQQHKLNHVNINTFTHIWHIKTLLFFLNLKTKLINYWKCCLYKLYGKTICYPYRRIERRFEEQIDFSFSFIFMSCAKSAQPTCGLQDTKIQLRFSIISSHLIS